MVSSIYPASLSLLENSKDIIIIFNTDGRYLYYNESQQYNLISDDKVGNPPLDIFDLETAPKINNHMMELEKAWTS